MHSIRCSSLKKEAEKQTILEFSGLCTKKSEEKMERKIGASAIPEKEIKKVSSFRILSPRRKNKQGKSFRLIVG